MYPARYPWTPLASIESDLGASAYEALSAVARDLLDENSKSATEQRWRCPRHELALLLGYLALSDLDGDLITPSLAPASSAQPVIEAAWLSGDGGSRAGLDLGLFGGVCGRGWVTQHLLGLAMGDEGLTMDNSTAAELDLLVLESLRANGGSMSHDLLGGLSGVGVYLLERLPCATAVEGLELVLDCLERCAETTEFGLAWRTRPERLSDLERASYPNGNFNLSLPHGVAGVAGFLNEACSLGIGGDRAERLLDQALSWLLASQRMGGSLSRFGLFTPDDLDLEPGFAWCWPDLGILLVLLRSARRTGRSDWRSAGESLLAHCLRWPSDLSGVTDASLYRGTSGVAHALNRIFQESGDVRCLEAAREWLGLALSMRFKGTGIGGFTNRGWSHAAGAPTAAPNPNLLEGAVGTGLALLAAISQAEPGWDRMMLFSGRTRSPHYAERLKEKG